jgi:hypothetical protein
MISALAALTGSAVGGLAPVLSNYVMQKGVTRRDLLNRQLSQRESLYSDFIGEASRLYAHAMTHELKDINDLVSLYALVSRIRLLASEPVVQSAETFVKLIVQHYGDPNMTVEQMRAAVLSAKADSLCDFSFACRKELEDILQRGEFSATIKH